MSDFKTIDSEKVSGKRVLVRVDLNVPMKNGQVTDATRIERAAPTLNELAAKGAKVIVLSHFGRPDGKRVPEMSLKPLVEPLAKALAKPVAFAEDSVGPQAEAAVGARLAWPAPVDPTHAIDVSEHDLAVLCHPCASNEFQAHAHRVRQARRAAHIKA